MRDYGKIFTTFWTSQTTRALSEDGRTLALYLLSSPHTNMIGVFRVPDGYVAEDLQWCFERVLEGFRNLQKHGFATRDEGSKWVVIHKHLAWNDIENPNQAKSAIKLLESVPDSVRSKPEVARLLYDSCERFRDKLPETLLNRLITLSKPFLNQEQEQEQDKRTTTPASESENCEPEFFTAGETNTEKPADENHPIWSWEPCTKITDELTDRYKIPIEFVSSKILEFKTYWSGRQKISNYDAKFIAAVQRGWKIDQHTWQSDLGDNHANRNQRNRPDSDIVWDSPFLDDATIAEAERILQRRGNQPVY